MGIPWFNDSTNTSGAAWPTASDVWEFETTSKLHVENSIF